MHTQPALSASDLSVSYAKDPVLAIEQARFARGTVTAIVGPNGCGKSTFLRALSRLQKPDHGAVELGSVGDITLLSAKEFAQHVAILSQQRTTPVGITVRDVVEYGRHPHRSRWRGQDPSGPAAIERALLLTGTADIADEPLETLSGGQLQRAWLASALAQDADVLLLDEPTNHLDLRYQVELLELIRDLAITHQVTVIVVLHDLNHAADVADHVIVIAEGAVVADAEPEQALRADLLSAVYGVPITVTVPNDGSALDIRAKRIRK